jgi:hypothetical protein
MKQLNGQQKAGAGLGVQRKHAAHSIVSNAVTRGQLHNNIIQWRAQAGARPAPRRPVLANKPLISARAENVILTLVALATLAVAHKTGVLAAIARVVGAL